MVYGLTSILNLLRDIGIVAVDTSIFQQQKMRAEGGIDHIKKAMIDLEKTHHYDVLFY